MSVASERDAEAEARLDAFFDQRWTDWLVKQLLDRRPRDELERTIASRGFPHWYAERKVAATAASPIFRAGARAYRQPRKLAGLIESLGTMFRRSGFEIEKLELTSTDFYSDFFFANRPVVLTGLMGDWPATAKWGPAYFKSRFGDVMVEITADRDSDQGYERNFIEHRTEVSFGDYVDMVERGGAGNDRYLVARNHVLDLPGLRALNDDIRCPAGFLDPDTDQRPFVRLWFGPAGTLTPLHCDDRNILFAQVLGRKRVRLIAPYFYGSLYNDDACYSGVDLDAIDLDRFPRMRDVPILETVLEPGEALFIPLGWWHWVHALEMSASLTFSNFYGDSPPAVWREVTA